MKQTLVLQLNKWKTIAALLLVCFIANGQEDINLDAYKNQFKGQPEVILHDIETYIIKKEKDGLDITQLKDKQSLVLTDLGAKALKDRFYSSQLSPVVYYDAFIINNKNKKVKIKEFNESSGSSSSVFFDDVKKIEVTYSGIEPGVRKMLYYETEFTDHNLLHCFVFKRQYAAKKLALEVEVDNEIELGYKVINDNGDIQFTKEKKGKKTIYKWIKENTTPYKYEPNNPGILYNEPHVAIFIKDANIKDKPAFLGDVPKLYSYYRTFVKDLNTSINDELKEIAKEVSSPYEVEEEKVKAIYYWVKENIKYIAYENGYEGFIPREANLVCERKFGDCKDMASIIKAMCNSVGIENVKLTWIGTREIPYTYEEMPTPGVDNHMIACYIKGEEYIFLDATDAMTKYPLPSSFIQGKDALVGIDENNFEIIKVPIVQGKENENKIEIACSREGNKMTGSASMSYSGLSRTSQVYRVSSIDEKRKFSNVKRSVILGNNKFILKDYKERNSEDRDLPYIIDFDFEIGNYAVEIGKEHFVNLFLKSHGILYELEDDRKTPYEIDKNQYINASVVYKLKDGEKATELPEAIDINNDLVSFQAKYVSENNEIKLNYTLETKKLLLLPEDFTQWNDSIESIKDYMENTLSIKQN